MHGEQGASRDEQVFKTLLEEENFCANSACTTATQMNTKNKTGSPGAQVCPAKLKHSISPFSPARKYKCQHRRFSSETTLVFVSSGYENMIYCNLHGAMWTRERKRVDSEDWGLKSQDCCVLGKSLSAMLTNWEGWDRRFLRSFLARQCQSLGILLQFGD